jgi:hypothetical protein
MMPFLLDTNIVSETIKPRPEGRVISWLGDQNPSDLYLASMTIGELVRGVRKLKKAARRRVYERWIEEDLSKQFDGRILPFDQGAAIIWGEIMGDGDRTGRTRPAADAQIAAVARRHNLTLATRNLKDFGSMKVKLFDPWTY